MSTIFYSGQRDFYISAKKDSLSDRLSRNGGYFLINEISPIQTEKIKMSFEFVRLDFVTRGTFAPKKGKIKQNIKSYKEFFKCLILIFVYIFIIISVLINFFHMLHILLMVHVNHSQINKQYNNQGEIN